jgi:hypothetical protein
MRRIFLISTLLLCRFAFAEDITIGEGKNPIKINGYLDLYYTYNFNQPAPVTPPTATNPNMPAPQNQYRVFDIYHDDINLALAEITLQKKQDEVSVFLALDFGHNADVLSPNDNVSKHVTQAYLTYQPHELPRLTLTAGKMLTHMGFEVPRAKDNWNYSRSLLFGFAFPFWQTGIGAKYSFLKETLFISAFLYNNTQGLYTTNRSKAFGAQINWKPLSNLDFFYNLLSGPEADNEGTTRQRYVHEVIGKWQINEQWAIAGDAAFGSLHNYYADGRSGSWVSGYGALKWKRGWFSLSPRFEMYVDKSGATIQVEQISTAAVPQRIDSTTLTASFDCGKGFETRLEGRYDHSTADVFVGGDGRLLGDQATATAAILYEF